MSTVDFKSAKEATLLAMYEHMMSSTGEEWLRPETLNGVMRSPYPIVYLRKVLESLEEEELIESRIPPNAGYTLYSMGERGILTVQGGLVAESETESLPKGMTRVDQPRFFASEGPVPDEFQGREGDIHLELLPASDRMVPISHNQPEYQEIRDGLNDLYEEFRSANDLPVETEERDRILTGLTAAKALWESTQLKIIQLKVGIIMAVEDAVAILKKIGKATGPSLLVGAIKAFIKHTTGIDL